VNNSEIGRDAVDWIYLVFDGDSRLALINAITYLRVLKVQGIRWLAEGLLVVQEKLCSAKLLIWRTQVVQPL